MASCKVAVRLIGSFTHSLAGLAPNDRVFVRGPFGEFVLSEQDKSVVLLAAGIGITPSMSMVREHMLQQSTRPMTLLFSCSSQNDIPFYDELKMLEERDPYLRVVFFITTGPTDRLSARYVLNGRIGETHLARMVGQDNRTFFLCGPKQFMRDMRTILVKKGVEPERLITEEFTSSSVGGKIMTPGRNVQRWTYRLTGAALVAGVAGIMALDIARFVPRTVSDDKVTAASTTQTAQATPKTSVPTSSTASAGPARSTSTTNTTPASSSSYTATTPSHPTPVYQPPVTSVS